MRISRNIKRATFSVTRPGVGCSIYQEHDGMVDEKLRRAIDKALEAFDVEYYGEKLNRPHAKNA